MLFLPLRKLINFIKIIVVIFLVKNPPLQKVALVFTHWAELMEGWNNGSCLTRFTTIPLFQYSNIPLFHYSTIPFI